MPIFIDDDDRRNFLARLVNAILSTDASCYAWALMPNHFHLLLVTGKESISKVMQSVLTGYAVTFNRKHERVGHLFQNRFRSILCEKDSYLSELIRYIHLNPVRAGIVSDLDSLKKYPWTGHSVLLGEQTAAWQPVSEVLKIFSSGGKSDAYLRFLQDGLQEKRPLSLPELLARGEDGLWRPEKMTESNRMRPYERILGSRHFITSTLSAQKETVSSPLQWQRMGMTPERAIQYAADTANVSVEDLMLGKKEQTVCVARALACKWLASDFRLKGAQTAKLLNISRAAVRKNIEKGKQVEEKMGLSLLKIALNTEATAYLHSSAQAASGTRQTGLPLFE